MAEDRVYTQEELKEMAERIEMTENAKTIYRRPLK